MNLQKAVNEGTALLLTPHAGQKVVFKIHRQDLTWDQAMEVRDLIKSQWGTEIPFVVIDDNVDVYVASDEELRNP